ncbi:hypothetical protein Zmor_004427 [Zophobas morio]|uniref:Dermonecrotic toxin N-terminal domain-containing protein n=1 Tax=Zophobas morio TaxID=2755281 RepID=A0AA38HHU9_9CUCU|nr:hypothetical protein Zmor_004427 [Zophobas morio]
MILQSLGPFPFLNLFLLKWLKNFQPEIFSTDIFYIENETDGHTLLFINGNSSPIHEFTSTLHMFSWFIEQCKNETKRAALLAHFPLSAAEEVTIVLEDFSNTEIDLIFLTYKIFDGSNSIFEAITYNIMTESKTNFPHLITSNRDVNKGKIMNILDFSALLILPFSLIFPELLAFDTLFMGIALAEIGIAVDDIRYGKEVGRSRLFFGIFNALPMVGVISKTRASLKTLSDKIKPFISEEEEILLQTKRANEVNERAVLDEFSFSDNYRGPAVLESFKDSEISKDDLIFTTNNKEPKKWEVKENVQLQRGGEDNLPPSKKAKYDLVSMNGVQFRNEGNSIVESSRKYLLPSELRPGDKYYVKNSKKEIKSVFYDAAENCWKYKFKTGMRRRLALTVYKEWEELSPELTVVIPHENFKESFPVIPENWEDLVNPAYSTDAEGPKEQVNGVIFKDGQYTILDQNEEKKVLYNINDNYWFTSERLFRIEFTTDKRWVEIDEAYPHPPSKINYITYEEYYRYISHISLNKNIKEHPVILNFVVTGDIPETFFDLIRIYQKAFENSFVNGESIVIYTYGEKATINLFEKVDNAIASLKIIDYKLLDDLPRFVHSVEPYLNSGQEALYSLLIRLKLSQLYPGIFLTLDHDIPVNIFNNKLLIDETGVLLPAPVYSEKLKRYLFPSNFFHSPGQQGRISSLLNNFLDNLKLAESSSTDIDDINNIFTNSVTNTIDKYDEYLKYYTSTRDVSGDLYHVRFSDFNYFNKVDKYFEQLSRLLIKRSNKWYRALKDTPDPSFSLLNDLENTFLMQQHDIVTLEVNNEARLLFSTNGDVRELYTFKKIDGKIAQPEKTNQLAYLIDASRVEILEEKITSSPPEDLTNYHPTKSVILPLNTEIVRDSAAEISNSVKGVSGDFHGVLFDVELNSWASYYKSRRGKVKLFKPVTLDNINEGTGMLLPTPPELIVLPPVPKVPRNLKKFHATVNLFVQDLSFVNIIDTYREVPRLTIHYDISDTLMHEFTRIMEEKSTFTWNNVREDPSFTYFFSRSELGKFYEAARINDFPEVAHNIMKYQIIKEKGGICTHLSESLTFNFPSFYKAKLNSVLLSLPNQKFYENSIRYVLSDELFASPKNNPFFYLLDKEIENSLKANNGYFGDILKGKRPGKEVFPTSDILGANAFHRAAIKYFPEIKALLNYLDHGKTDLLYYREFQDAKDYFFPFKNKNL